jgi:hypothetical protein
MATYIHGIAASENIDSSGERISIAGMDISSLEADGVFNYEHEQGKINDKEGKPVELQVKVPAQVVGKILKAKKIFSEEDCEDNNQLRFWRKIETPYLYVMGELFDDYTDAAKDLAGKFQYDADRKDQNERYVNNFSVEGGRLERKGMEITKSVGRKVTITSFPCNKAAIAEILPKAAKDDLSNVFKSEPSFEIELFKPSSPLAAEIVNFDDIKKHAEILGIEPMNKSMASSPAAPAKSPAKPVGQTTTLPSKTNNPGTHMGSTQSGKAIHSHAKIHEYHGFSAKDHHEAAGMHHAAAQAAKTPELGNHHLDKMKLHMQAAKTAESKNTRYARGKGAKVSAIKTNLQKAMDAGSAMAAPSQLTGTAALSKESLDKKKWLARAEEEYDNWDKKEQFVAFMKSRMPHLAKGEIDAIGRTLALKKSLDAENALSRMAKSEHEGPTFSEHPEHKLHPSVKKAALAHHKKNPGAISSVETERDGSHWLHLKGHTIDNDGQHSWHSKDSKGLLSDMKNIRPCRCDECK